MTAENEAAGTPLPRDRGRWVTRTQKLAIIGTVAAAGVGAMVLSNWLPDHQSTEKDSTPRVSGPGIPLKQPGVTKSAPLPLPATAPSVQNIVAPVIPQINTSKATDAPVLSFASAESPGASKGAHGGGAEGEARLKGAKEQDDPLTASLRPAGIGGASKAHRIKNPDTTINRGTPIPCALQTAINSQLPGFVTCLTQSEVRSLSGKVTLADRGTQLFGEVKYGLQNGADRLFILWRTATIPMRTRNGVEYVDVELDSPAAGPIGEPGVGGDVDTHFFKRFGAALLFSVVQAAPQIASSALQHGNNNNNSFTSFSSASPSESVVGAILNKQMSIPDTLSLPQGSTVVAMVARPLDFSSVVGFELKDD